MDFAATARLIRKRKGCTQRAMAKLLGITAGHLCNIERGHSRPSLALCERYEIMTGYNLYDVARRQHRRTWK